MMSVVNPVLELVSLELCEIFPAVPLKQASKMSSLRNLQLEIDDKINWFIALFHVNSSNYFFH